jgi:hypothetical protein
MSDEKILDLKTGKAYELVTGTPNESSPEQVLALLTRMLNYARERKFMAVGIIMVDEKTATITGYHMEEGMSTALAGGTHHLAHRLHVHMDSE